MPECKAEYVYTMEGFEITCTYQEPIADTTAPIWINIPVSELYEYGGPVYQDIEADDASLPIDYSISGEWSSISFSAQAIISG